MSFFHSSEEPQVMGISSYNYWISSDTEFSLVHSNPNASLKTKVILNYLVDLPTRSANKVLVGQHVGSSAPSRLNPYTYNFNLYVEPINASTGKYPALIGADFSSCGNLSDPENGKYALDMLNKLVEHSNNGGIVTVSWHMTNPWTAIAVNCMTSNWGCKTVPRYDGCLTDNVNVGPLSDLYTPGNAIYDEFHLDLDQKATWLKYLEDRGVVVLFRPFHEMNGAWMWWENRDKSQYIALWQHVYNYYTITKGLNNLIWIYAPNRNDGDIKEVLYYYPGDAYVDIVGLDYYYYEGLSQGFSNVLINMGTNGANSLLTLNKPFAISEFGPGSGGSQPSPNIFDNQLLITNIKTYVPNTTYFLTWNGNYSIKNQNNVSGLINDSWSITRDEVDYQKSIDGVANFSANQTSGTAPFTVEFTDRSTNNPQTYAWDFNNDGVTDSNISNPSYTYTTPGTYSVRLTTQSLGVSKTKVETNIIVVSSSGGSVAPGDNTPIVNVNNNGNSIGPIGESEDIIVFIPIGNENIFLTAVVSKLEGDYIRIDISYTSVNTVDSNLIKIGLDPSLIKEVVVNPEKFSLYLHKELVLGLNLQVLEIPIRIEDTAGNYFETVISTRLPEFSTQRVARADRIKTIGIVIGTISLMGITYTYLTLSAGKFVVNLLRRSGSSGSRSDWNFFN